MKKLILSSLLLLSLNSFAGGPIIVGDGGVQIGSVVECDGSDANIEQQLQQVYKSKSIIDNHLYQLRKLEEHPSSNSVGDEIHIGYVEVGAMYGLRSSYLKNPSSFKGRCELYNYIMKGMDEFLMNIEEFLQKTE